jgi:hypothetical protein
MTTDFGAEKCPVCGIVLQKRNMIFHMRKRSVFEIYDWYKDGYADGLDPLGNAPHQRYIEQHSRTEKKFTM